MFDAITDRVAIFPLCLLDNSVIIVVMTVDNSVRTTHKQQRERPQDLKFSLAELERAFGKRMSHSEYLQSLKANFDRYETEEES